MTRPPARAIVLATPRTAVAMGCLVLLLAVVSFPLASLAHVSALSGAGDLVLGAVFGVVGFVVAWRRPGNRIGWLLFPDGRLPSSRWRWAMWAYLAVAGLWIAGTLVISVQAIAGQHIQVDAGGDLLIIDHPTGSAAWWGAVQSLFFPVLGACWLASVIGQAASYRRSSGERRQQLKWLVGGSVIAVAGGLLAVPFSDSHNNALRIAGGIGLISVLALPASMGVAILRYRLYDIDRIASRTVTYALVTGLPVGVYVGLVLLATQVLGFASSWSVAASTLAAAALFAPLRRRVQRVVDRRFNRARYDADLMVAVFAARLASEVDLAAVGANLTGAVTDVLQPAHLWLWLAGGGGQ